MNRLNFLLTGLLLSSLFHAQAQKKNMSKEGITYGHETFDLTIEVYHRDSRRPMNDVKLYLYSMPEERLISTAKTKRGRTGFRIIAGKEYKVKSCKSLFIPGGINLYNCYEEDKILCINGAFSYDFITVGGTESPNAILTAQMAIDSVIVGKTFQMESVYYDLNKSTLRESSKQELDQLYELLIQYPGMVVELASHTDSRGGFAYNEKLSAARAQSCFEYLLGKGIAPEQILPKGYGETRLRNHCSDGVICSALDHQKNRRTEFTVLSFEAQECPSEAIGELSAR